MDDYELTRAMDRTKSKLLTGNSAFLGSLMCSLHFEWDSSIPTACTNGVFLRWNPEWYISLPIATREMVLAHEVWHVARLHNIRRGTRDPELWNYACDIRINNDLEKQGFTFEGITPWKDHSYPEDMPEEDIYDILVSNNVKPPPCDMANDLDEDADPSEEGRIQQLQAVSRAKQQASMIGGSVPGDVEKLLKEFLDPVIRWEVQLQNFFTELIVDDFSWRKPSRRHQEIYLPSLVADESRLEHLEYYVDISGSISDDMIIRFNSELKYIKDTLNPQKLSVIMFDTQICDVFEFTESDSFDKIKVVGGGGTSLAPVRERINTSRPTAAVIFTDLCCHPMAPLDYPVPIIWVVVGNPHAVVPFGTAIHIKE